MGWEPEPLVDYRHAGLDQKREQLVVDVRLREHNPTRVRTSKTLDNPSDVRLERASVERFEGNIHQEDAGVAKPFEHLAFRLAARLHPKDGPDDMPVESVLGPDIREIEVSIE